MSTLDALRVALDGLVPDLDALQLSLDGLMTLEQQVVPLPAPPVFTPFVIHSPCAGNAGGGGGGGGGGQAWSIGFDWPKRPVVTVPKFVVAPLVFEHAFDGLNLRPHSWGIDGAVATAKAVAAAAWQSRVSEDVRAFVLQAVSDADARTAMQRAEALTSEVRAALTYLPDPVAADRVTHPSHLAQRIMAGQLVSGDCADHAGLLATCLANIGMRAALVVQWNDGEQPHVIVAAKIDGRWVHMDPSTEIAFGERLDAEHEVWVPLPGTMPSAKSIEVPEQEEEPVFVGVAGADSWTAPSVRVVAPPTDWGRLPVWTLMAIGAAIGAALAAWLVWHFWVAKAAAKQLPAKSQS